MHAHTPPYTRNPPPTAREVYDETSAIAAAQDAKSDMTEADRYAKLRTAAHYLYHAKLLMDEVFGSWRIQSDTYGIPAESAYLASFGPNLPAYRFLETDEMVSLSGKRFANAGALRESGIGDVEPRHVMQAEADRLIGPEDRL